MEHSLYLSSFLPYPIREHQVFNAVILGVHLQIPLGSSYITFSICFCRKFQQEYQSFFHRSFRVSDFLPGENLGVRDLIKACPGVNVCMCEGALE